MDKVQELFASELLVVNVGPRLFAEEMELQNTRAVQVDWRPLAGGDEEMQGILNLLGM